MPAGRSHLLGSRECFFVKMYRIHLEFTLNHQIQFNQSPNWFTLIWWLNQYPVLSPTNQSPNPTLPRLTLGLRCTEKRLAGLNRVPYLTVFFYIVNLRVPKRNMFDLKDLLVLSVCIYIYIYCVLFIYSFSSSIYIYMFMFIYIYTLFMQRY